MPKIKHIYLVSSSSLSLTPLVFVINYASIESYIIWWYQLEWVWDGQCHRWSCLPYSVWLGSIKCVLQPTIMMRFFVQNNQKCCILIYLLHFYESDAIIIVCYYYAVVFPFIWENWNGRLGWPQKHEQPAEQPEMWKGQDTWRISKHMLKLRWKN